MDITLSPGFARPAWPWPARVTYGAAFAAGRFSRAGQNVPADQAFSVSRASARFTADSGGHWHQFSPDMPAITDLGLSVEPETTNENPNAANLGAAPSITEALDALPIGWDRAKFDGTQTKGQIVEIGTWLGLPSLTIRLWGDSNVGDAELRWFIWGNLGDNLPIADDDKFLVSFFLQRIAGSNANVTARMRMTERDSGGNYLVKQVHGFSPSADPVRHAKTFAVASTGAARAVMGLEFGFAGPFDITFRLAAVQIERTANTIPTSPILSAGTPATRQPDFVTLNLPHTLRDLNVTYSDGTAEVLTGRAGETVVAAKDLAMVPVRTIAG